MCFLLNIHWATDEGPHRRGVGLAPFSVQRLLDGMHKVFLQYVCNRVRQDLMRINEHESDARCDSSNVECWAEHGQTRSDDVAAVFMREANNIRDEVES